MNKKKSKQTYEQTDIYTPGELTGRGNITEVATIVDL